MKLQFKTRHLVSPFLLKEEMPRGHIRSIKLSFFKDLIEVDVLLDASSSLTGRQLRDLVHKVKDDLMIQTLRVGATEEETEARTDIRKYRFRAECLTDVEGLLIELPKDKLASITIFFHNLFFDVDALLCMKDHMKLDEVRYYMHRVADGHVMWQTVQSEQHYTGKRGNNLDHDLLDRSFTLN